LHYKHISKARASSIYKAITVVGYAMGGGGSDAVSRAEQGIDRAVGLIDKNVKTAS